MAAAGNRRIQHLQRKTDTNGPELVAPESDGSLKHMLNMRNEFSGRTTLVLELEDTDQNRSYNVTPKGVETKETSNGQKMA